MGQSQQLPALPLPVLYIADTLEIVLDLDHFLLRFSSKTIFSPSLYLQLWFVLAPSTFSLYTLYRFLHLYEHKCLLRLPEALSSPTSLLCNCWNPYSCRGLPSSLSHPWMTHLKHTAYHPTCYSSIPYCCLWSHHVAQAGLEFINIHLPLPPLNCWE